ncbi:carbohydrate ABC transporter permease [Streptomyces sp. FIT100]|uniref:carbohydrate ABC transporter permease n=1 Tax=Streptomyces sp. FIT100 TaxID=2837956 RepID=UPI0021C57F41|nr:carbohydrate ABC transporter permease [Streptomyces sp. FIT100]UUN30631.1 carbohydrate ABC transporter permease [Streptomyces sp. FIT100]
MSLALEDKTSAAPERFERPAWKEKPKPITQAAKAVALVVTVLVVVVPFWTVIATSFAPDRQVIANGGYALWPEQWTFAAYGRILEQGQVTTALGVSVGITIAGTLFSLFCTVTLAYALARPGVVGGKPVMIGILFTFLFPAGFIPTFLVVKSLGLYDSYAALILPVLVNAFNLVVMRGFFQGIPNELFESAKIDGAGELRILCTIVLPLSKAVIAVVGLFYAVSYWNSWFNAVLLLGDTNKWPLQALMRTYVIGTTNGNLIDVKGAVEEQMIYAPQTTNMAVVVLATVPILILYPFVQRYFTKGVLTGAIKS